MVAFSILHVLFSTTRVFLTIKDNEKYTYKVKAYVFIPPNTQYYTCEEQMICHNLQIFIHGQRKDLQHLVKTWHRLQPNLFWAEGALAVTLKDTSPLTFAALCCKTVVKKEYQW